MKALRTSVGWFSSPACSLIYQVSKYVALFSSKGYAIGENFAQWLAHKLKTTEQLAGDLLGHVEDLLAICGGRDYIFFLDAAVVDRFSQLESLYGYLLEEADMGAEGGGRQAAEGHPHRLHLGLLHGGGPQHGAHLGGVAVANVRAHHL